ncbi:MAG: hypothetical protein AAF515_07345 [Pseudomonadota bacterium]
MSQSTLSAAASIACALGLALGAAPATAELSSHAQLRGYNACVAELESTRPLGLTTNRVYYTAPSEAGREYFINAGVWENGVRAAKRLRCETSANGRQVLDFEVAGGRYAQADNNALKVAGSR